MLDKYAECEHCKTPRLESQSLWAVDCWAVSDRDQRRRPSYWYVCRGCYETRHDWCDDVFPDVCANCGREIPEGSHYLKPEYNRRGEQIVSHGIAQDETCNIVCEKCHDGSEGT